MRGGAGGRGRRSSWPPPRSSSGRLPSLGMVLFLVIEFLRSARRRHGRPTQAVSSVVPLLDVQGVARSPAGGWPGSRRGRTRHRDRRGLHAGASARETAGSIGGRRRRRRGPRSRGRPIGMPSPPAASADAAASARPAERKRGLRGEPRATCAMARVDARRLRDARRACPPDRADLIGPPMGRLAADYALVEFGKRTLRRSEHRRAIERWRRVRYPAGSSRGPAAPRFKENGGDGGESNSPSRTLRRRPLRACPMICRQPPERASAACRTVQSRAPRSGLTPDYVTLVRIASSLDDASTTHEEEVASTLTLLPKQRERESTGGCQVLLFAT